MNCEQRHCTKHIEKSCPLPLTRPSRHPVLSVTELGVPEVDVVLMGSWLK
jgi:acyl CoA:acetate/3-ketoacid CoA transferase beta subunit